MHLKSLAFFDFKNYQEATFRFEGKVNCLLGKNGVGKTNILDGIHYLSFTKSAFIASDAQNIRHGMPQFVVKGKFEVDERMWDVTCSYSTSSRKSVRVNELETDKLSNHIGKFPTVLVAPNDIELIWGGSEMRRKFFDTLIAQIDKSYLEQLIVYNNQLRQRNSLLRFSADRSIDYDLLETYDHKLSETGSYIHQRRGEFLKSFLPVFKRHYTYLVDDASESVEILYKSDCDVENLRVSLKKNLQRDISLQRTSTGIHRDEFLFQLNGYELKKLGSQGQQKSFLIGLKLAEFQSIEAVKNTKPVLLLDDIFDKLDDERIHKLVSLVVGETFGQLFITDARPDRSQGLLKEAGIDAELFMIENGKLQEVS